MTDQQWRAAWELYRNGYSLPPEQFSSFLADATADGQVRQAVEQLVSGTREAASDPGPEGLPGQAPELPERIGQRIGRYTVTERLGAGGMGTVYSARDSELGRSVAIKFLSDRLSDDASIERSTAEARAASALNHPNIVTIYDVVRLPSRIAIVMELVEGTALRHLGGIPLPLDRLLHIGEQIGRALRAVHERGIVHCDIKPENLMLRQDGVVKVLDFGLARDSSLLSSRSNLHSGTLRYMAPERSQGESPTSASDIFSLGIVLYELATSVHPFESGSILETIDALNRREACAPSSFNPFLPNRFDELLLRMLAKDPEQRPSAAEVVRNLESHFQVELSTPPPAEQLRARNKRHTRAWIVPIAAAAIALSPLAWSGRRLLSLRHQTPRPFVRLDLDVGGEVSQMAISQDGSELVFLEGDRLILRRLAESSFVPLAGTEGASYPFFSPNGNWIAFFADGKLRKIAVEGGAPVTICNAQSGRGGSWGDDGMIVATLTSTGGLSRVPSNGGAPFKLTQVQGEEHGVTSDRWPQVLPGGRGVLYTAAFAGGAMGSLCVLPKNGCQAKTLVENSPYGRFLTAGFLSYYQNGKLFAVPFDLERLEITGPAILITDGVAADTVRGAVFEASPSGTVVYRGGLQTGGAALSLVNSAGSMQQLAALPGAYLTPRLSPDGKRVAVALMQNGEQNLWIFDLAAGHLKRLTFDREPELLPVWTPDGKYIVFRSNKSLAWTSSDGSGSIGCLPSSAQLNVLPYGFSSDGKWLAFAGGDTETGLDLYVAPVEKLAGSFRLGEPHALLREAGGQYSPSISPDGRWVAYSSDETGRAEVFVRSLSPDATGVDGKWQVSSDGGVYPVWSRQGGELFYRSPERYVMESKYVVRGGSFVASTPKRWSDWRLEVTGGFPSFDSGPERESILGLFEPQKISPERDLRVLLNVTGELQRRMQGKGG